MKRILVFSVLLHLIVLHKTFAATTSNDTIPFKKMLTLTMAYGGYHIFYDKDTLHVFCTLKSVVVASVYACETYYKGTDDRFYNKGFKRFNDSAAWSLAQQKLSKRLHIKKPTVGITASKQDAYLKKQIGKREVMEMVEIGHNTILGLVRNTINFQISLIQYNSNSHTCKEFNISDSYTPPAEAELLFMDFDGDGNLELILNKYYIGESISEFYQLDLN